jgi:hypothetical protein
MKMGLLIDVEQHVEVLNASLESTILASYSLHSLCLILVCIFDIFSHIATTISYAHWMLWRNGTRRRSAYSVGDAVMKIRMRWVSWAKLIMSYNDENRINQKALVCSRAPQKHAARDAMCVALLKIGKLV